MAPPNTSKNGSKKQKGFTDLCNNFVEACAEMNLDNQDPVSELITQLRSSSENQQGLSDSDMVAIKVVNLLLPANVKIEKIRSGVRLNSYEIDKQNQYSRRENLRITGIGETEHEDVFNKFKELCNAMNVNIEKNDIVSCHRIGKEPTAGKLRSIIVRFFSRDLKYKIMSNKKVLKGKLDYKDIFINEDLTMLRLKMLNMVKKHDNVKSVFTRDGKINCFLRNGRKKIIENPDDLFEGCAGGCENISSCSSQDSIRNENVSHSSVQNKIVNGNSICLLNSALSENSKELSLSNVSNENISGNVVLNPSCSFNSVCSSICSEDVKNQSHYSVSNKNHTCNSNLALHSSYSFNSESSCSVNLKNSKDVISSIKVLSLNVCGILAKLKAPELEELCSNYDIVCFCETKLDELDVVEIDHFSSCENVLWFVVNQLFDVPVLFGTVYIPPVNSIYSSIDIFDVIEDDLITFITEKDYKVCLIGDFNAHTGTKPDYIVLDEYICNSMQLDNIPSHDININNLDKFGININRASLDKSVDNYGNRLLQLCKSLELFIANGRLGKDSGIGALTCKEATVVDYCILSPELFTHVCEFKILPFDAMISDVHNGVHIEFMSTNKPNVGIQVNDVNKNGNVTVKPKWDNEKYQSFVDNLNDTEIDNICEKLNVLEVENIDKSVINNLVEDCNIIIRDAADASGLFNIICNNSVSGSRRKNKPNKPWFNRECFVKCKKVSQSQEL
ncbi:unnamed protein product [Mytilus coruscus]|uniref:Endonuclease/exonuclease/phosphatase domain-containing protein n=1 Tax=Mytilus coruscus TaxID=42192 RepID=A0A6J8E516_MYTCO|nr:unnamed protein product [Mytilus coruscus]